VGVEVPIGGEEVAGGEEEVAEAGRGATVVKTAMTTSENLDNHLRKLR
jgi:hypothetical protein